MLRDPIRALEAVRRVCRGGMILLERVIRPLALLPAPLAQLDARRDGSERFVFNRRGLQKALELAGWVVEESRRSYETDRGREPVRMLTISRRAALASGIRGRSAATRARSLK